MNLAYLLDPVFQIDGNNGKPLVNGRIEVYLAGTDEKYVTYQSFDGVKNPFKVPLSADGRATVLADQTQHYDIYVYDSFSNLVCSRKNVSCVGFVNVVTKDNVQVVTYDVTQWSDIDFTKNLLLRYISHDTVVSTATYTADDTSLKFYAYIDGEVYVVQLLHDTNEWSATVLDTSETYIATYDATTLEELNQLSTDVLVYMKQDDAVYMNSYRSTTEWRFTQIDGDMLNEAVLKASGWTETSQSLAGMLNVRIDYGVTPTQTFDQLVSLAERGYLYCVYQTTMFTVNSATSNVISFTKVINEDLRYVSIARDLTWRTGIDKSFATIEQLNTKQPMLTAGDHIQINDYNIISTIPDTTKVDIDASNATRVFLGTLLSRVKEVAIQARDTQLIPILTPIDDTAWSISMQSMFDYIYGKLQIDSTPTKDSTNLVSSGGVYTAIAPLNYVAFSCVNFDITPEYQTANAFEVKSKSGTLLFTLSIVLGQSNLLVLMQSPINTWRCITEDHVGTTVTFNTYQVNSNITSKQLLNIDWTKTHNANIQLCQSDKRLDINLYHYSNYASYSLQFVSNTSITKKS